MPVGYQLFNDELQTVFLTSVGGDILEISRSRWGMEKSLGEDTIFVGPRGEALKFLESLNLINPR
jgi:hypothetical protein